MGCNNSKIIKSTTFIPLNIIPVEKNINDIHILIIDGSPFLLKLVSKLLERKSLKNNTAMSPAIALKDINENWEINKRTYDIIIINIITLKLDDMFIEKIKQFEKDNDTNKHLVFCLTDKDRNISYNREHINYILFKPFSIDDFMEIIRKHYIF
jgi:response regulator RpfG family c-di-GMP phosphodiesterase